MRKVSKIIYFCAALRTMYFPQKIIFKFNLYFFVRYQSLLDLLRTLTPEENSDFAKLLRHWHDSEDLAMRVFAYLQKFRPNYDDEKRLDLDYVSRMIFSKAISEHKNPRKDIQKVVYSLADRLTYFMLEAHLRSNDLSRRAAWLKVLEGKGFDKSEKGRETYSDAVEDLCENTLKAPRPDFDYCFEGMAANYHSYSSLTHQITQENLGKMGERLHDFEVYSETLRLRMACEIANRKFLAQQESALDELPSMNDRIKSDWPLYQLYQALYRLLSTQDKAYFEALEQSLPTYIGKVGTDVLLSVIRYMANFAGSRSRRINGSDYIQKLHDLDKLALEHKLYNEDSKISNIKFANIVNTACTVGAFGWAENFVAQNQALLPEEAREDVVILCQGIIAYEQKDYGTVTKLFRNRSFKDENDSMRAKMFMLRAMVDNGEDADDINEYCATFERWLHRHKENYQEVIVPNLLFVQITRAFILERTEKEVLQERFDKAPAIHCREWLEEKLKHYDPRYVPPKKSRP